jgi:hypothetical protein
MFFPNAVVAINDPRGSVTSELYHWYRSYVIISATSDLTPVDLIEGSRKILWRDCKIVDWLTWQQIGRDVSDAHGLHTALATMLDFETSKRSNQETALGSNCYCIGEIITKPPQYATDQYYQLSRCTIFSEIDLHPRREVNLQCFYGHPLVW